MSEEQSKELVLTHPIATTKESSKPRFINLGRGREVSTSGLRVPLVINYLMRKATEKYVPIGELSAVFCGGNTIPGKKRVRANLAKISIAMARDYEQILITETEGKGEHYRTSAVKVMDVNIPGERQAGLEKLERMRRRREIGQKHYDIIANTLCRFAESGN